VTLKWGIGVRIVFKEEDRAHLREKIAFTSDYCAIQPVGIDLQKFTLCERRMILQDFTKTANIPNLRRPLRAFHESRRTRMAL